MGIVKDYGGGTIYAPKGTYLLKSSIHWASKVSLKGAGVGETIFTVNGKGFAMIYQIDGKPDG
ncbi:glycoside hydrolase family 55 protein, partial [Bacillus pseudomycoides]|uniref:glycoside hydrolase family 55 protein n=1 Tax=Bacillus pseudomycoides TaxID=64104 RepID=UPI00211D6C30